MTLRETIRELTAAHLDAGHLVMGQCLSAVGWVGGTLPERKDMTELPCSDVAGAGFVVGAALVRRRPIYVVRYQGFQWFNVAIIVNYAAKSKELWEIPCPLLVRSVAMEGRIGPVAGSSHHSIYHRMPGLKSFAPMTPDEWRAAYHEFMKGDDVVFLSEHRGAWGSSEELPNLRPSNPELVLFPISITRFAAQAVAKELALDGLRVAVHHIWRLKPFSFDFSALSDLRHARFGGVVLDDDYPDGIAKTLAHDLSAATGARMCTLGLQNRTAGFGSDKDNLPPDQAAIKEFIQNLFHPKDKP